MVPWAGPDTRFSITACTDLTDPLGFALSEPRTDSNTALDFLDFVIELVEFGTIGPGDYLFLDNASIHCAAEIMPALDALFDSIPARLIYLPAYSPELNPAELIFSKVKRWLRNHRENHGEFWFEILRAFATVEFADVLSFYEHAIEHFDE